MTDENALSRAFLATHRPRLDAIGAWAVLASGDELDIDWPRPAALAAHGFPFDLRFHVYEADADADSVCDLDPDARMFALWELFLARQAEFIAQIRRQIVAPDGRWHAAESAELLVERFRDEEGDTHAMSVYLHFALDSEHQVVSEYDEDLGTFGLFLVQ